MPSYNVAIADKSTYSYVEDAEEPVITEKKGIAFLEFQKEGKIVYMAPISQVKFIEKRSG